ncbi:MAG: hypothetical protein JO360_16355 [Acidobacteria bacterium]|nr:hypothetical protein [Acidobacteriota bacterium]
MTTDNPHEQWQPHPGNQPSTLALPDYFSYYYSYSIDTTQIPNVGLRITGDFPYARYMSFNVYATTAGTSLGARTDYQIVTESPNVNPFVAGSDEDAVQRQYVVNVQPIQSTEVTGQQKPANLLTFDPAALGDGKLTVIIRYYVTKDDDPHGGVSLPTVIAYDVADPNTPLKPQPTPIDTTMDPKTFAARLAPVFLTASRDDDTLRFYHAEGVGQFNNADNIYLISAVENVDGVNNGVILKIKPPTYPRSNDKFDQVSVRYWSFNQGNPNTSTPFGMSDQELRPAKDGFVYIVMGDESFRARALQHGYNYMPWKADHKRAVILYRNMLTTPQYRGSIERVPTMQPPPPPLTPALLEANEASQFIGTYAPVGKKISAIAFQDLSGVWPSPGFA